MKRKIGFWNFDTDVDTIVVGKEFMGDCQVRSRVPFCVDRFDNHVFNSMDDQTSSIRVEWDDDGIVTAVTQITGWARNTRPVSKSTAQSDFDAAQIW
jgi:hypothetical protein